MAMLSKEEKKEKRAAYQRQYRKNNASYRQQENKRRKEERKHFTSRQRSKQQLQAMLRKRAERDKKKLAVETISGAYKVPNTATRAVRKVLKAVNKFLPHSPKKRAFVKSIVGNRLLDSPLLCSQARDNKAKSIPTEVIALVRKFYENDEISTQTPGQKEFVQIGDTQIQKVIKYLKLID
jgi:hypothetical protein